MIFDRLGGRTCMVIFEITMSLDGYVAGPDATLEEPLGKGGERLHEWVYGLASWRRSHGLEGGEESRDSELLEESVAGNRATVMGRRMFSGGEGPWGADPNPNGWWGDDPPFRHPVFVVTHHARDPLVLGETTFTFVTDGPEAALAAAREAAGDGNVNVAGGASVGQQLLRAGLVDELRLHVAPLFLGGGVRLFEGLEPRDLEIQEVIASPRVTHLRYR
jgi:dihydrofolate reductase